MKKLLFSLLLLCSMHTLMFAQFEDEGGNDVLNTEYQDNMFREGKIGIGYNTPGSLPSGFGWRFLLKDSSYAHVVGNSTFGSFAAGNKWLGLGIGNPGGSPNPYGLALVDNTNLGFYNLINEVYENATRTNTIAGFGANGNNQNRFIVRAYSGTNGATAQNILIADPNGAVGINAEPQSSFWVDATLSSLDSVPVRAIAIRGNQPLPGSGSTRTATAIGAQANTSLAATGIAVEGLRAQIPDFATVALNLAGVATNLQTVKNGTGTAALDVITPALSVTDEYAELTWQDLDFGDDAQVDCDSFPIADAEELDKFFISFRNNENTNPFAPGNKLPIMTFQANGRVGIGKLQPTSGSCTPLDKRPVLLDVNGLINANGTLIGSDRRFKKDIETIPNSMELIRKMRGTTYTLNTKDFPDRNFSSGKQYGFIAQEVAEVIPELALLNSDGYYAVNYTMLIPVLTEAIKEQDSTMIAQAEVISTLQTELSELRSTVADLKADRESQGTQGFILEQNAPNPFSNSTVIGYALPSGTNGAVISVYDLTGRTLRSFNLSDGEGQITLNAGDLPEGLYIYDLQVNGRQVLERKMSVARR